MSPSSRAGQPLAPSNGHGAEIETPGVPDEDLVGDRKAVARLHRVYQGTVTRWVKDGMRPIEGGGRGKAAKFLLSDTVAFRVAQLEARAGAGTVNPVLERALKDRAQRQLADQLRARRAGETIDVAEVRHVLSSVVLATRSQLLRLAPTLAPECAREDNPAKVQALIDQAVRQALEELARGDGLIAATTTLAREAGIPASRKKGRTP